jgi:malic enzyme
MCSCRFQKTELRDARLLFYGAGSSAVGVADSIASYMRAKAEMSWEEARGRIYMVDSKGGRPHALPASAVKAALPGAGCVTFPPAACVDRQHKAPPGAGLITTTRGDELPERKKRYARDDGTADAKDLEEIVGEVKPHALIGLSAAGG